MTRFFKKLFRTSQGVQLTPTQGERAKTVYEKELTLDPSYAPVIELPKSYRPQEEYQSRWPEGFWEHMNKGVSYYKRGWYDKAKEEFLHARSLKNDYDGLNTQLLRAYRKLYQKAADKKRWRDAYKVLLELFETLPIELTDTDRRQYKRVVEEIQKTETDFTSHIV